MKKTRFHWRHRWSTWGDATKAEYMWPEGSFDLIQFRFCYACNKKEKRVI